MTKKQKAKQLRERLSTQEFIRVLRKQDPWGYFEMLLYPIEEYEITDAELANIFYCATHNAPSKVLPSLARISSDDWADLMKEADRLFDTLQFLVRTSNRDKLFWLHNAIFYGIHEQYLIATKMEGSSCGLH